MYPLQTIFDMTINWDSQRIPVRASERKKGPYPYYGAQGIVDYVDDYIFDGFYILVAEDGENLRSQKENVATLASGKFWVNNHAHVISSKPHCNTKYIFYALSDIDFTSYITGSTIPKLSQASLGNIELPCPSLEVQDAIASILGSLDDKIDLNRRTNETLEAMARALFRDWFVDFGPTRAKMAGEAPYLAPELWELFPDRLDDEGKPEGWNSSNIYDVASVVYGAPFASSLFNTQSEGIPLVRIRDLPSEKPGVCTTEVHPKGFKILPGMIVVGMDGEFRAHLWGGEEAWLNQRVCVFQPKDGISSVFLRETIIPQLKFIEDTEVATTVIHLGKGDIDAFTTLVPSHEIMASFNNMAQIYYDKFVLNKQESRTLAQLRDLLLPKLMSGAISILDAEKMVEDVA